MKLSRAYTIGGVALLALYFVIAVLGHEFGNEERGRVPRDARSRPGGYRSYHVWGLGK